MKQSSGLARTELSETRAMIALAAPLALQQVGNHLMGLVDAAMLGRYSDAALAGAGVGNNLYFGLTCIGLGIIMGMDTVVPQALGAGRHDDARRSVGAGVRLAVLVGLLTTLLVFASPLLLEVAHVERDVLHEARAFVYMRALGAVPFLISIALRSYLAAHGKTRPLVLAVVIGNLMNVALDYLFIYTLNLGVIGAAMATTLVQSAMAVVYALAVRAIDSALPSGVLRAPAQPGLAIDEGAPRPRSTTPDIMAIIKYGLPVGGQLFAEVGIFGIATVLAAHFGKIPAGAHSIALGISSLTFAFSVGIASATSVRVGHAVGAGELAVARRRGIIGIAIGLCVMACFAATFVLIPRVLATGFTADAAMIAATIPLLQIAALFQLSDGTQAIGAGALRGLGDTRATFVANLIGHYAIGLPLVIGLGFWAGLRTNGMWIGLSAGLTATAIALVARFLHKTRSTTRSRR